MTICSAVRTRHDLRLKFHNSISIIGVTSHNHDESLLLLLPLLLILAMSLPPTTAVPVHLMPFVGTPSYVECVGHGVYVANSTFEANRRRLAGILAEEAPRGPYQTTDLAVGYWPNRLQAFVFCWRRDGDGDGTGGSGSSSCAACIADAFLEVDRACPYHREAFVSSRNCSLQLSEFRIFGDGGIFENGEGSVLSQALASGLIFQAVGFAWLFFLLLQEWRSRKRGTLMRSTPLSSGD